MKSLLKLLLVFMFFFLQLILSFNIQIGLIFSLGLLLFFSEKDSYMFAFLFGLLIDLVGGTLWWLPVSLFLVLLLRMADLVIQRIYRDERRLGDFVLVIFAGVFITGLELFFKLPFGQALIFFVLGLAGNVVMAIMIYFVFFRRKFLWLLYGEKYL